jgi:hypothetical protein
MRRTGGSLLLTSLVIPPRSTTVPQAELLVDVLPNGPEGASFTPCWTSTGYKSAVLSTSLFAKILEPTSSRQLASSTTQGREDDGM